MFVKSVNRIVMEKTTRKPTFLKVPAKQDVFQQLREEVNHTVKRLEKKREPIITIKAILFPALYFSFYIIALLAGKNSLVLYACYVFLGLLIDLNFLNLIHEAVHNALFKSKTLNKLYVHLFDVMGANSYIWRLRHIRLHHNYPNVLQWDSDFEQSPMARVFPNAPYSPIHRYQHIYLPMLYPLFLFNWLFVRDFKDFFRKKQLVHKVAKIPAIEYIKLGLFKLFFLTYLIVIPKLVLHITWMQILVAFFIMILTASIFGLIVLVTPHAVPDSSFPITDKNGQLPTSWFEHQLRTTNDVAEDNWFTRFFMGCFNYHIAHHLFPSVNHVYYPEITALVKKFAEKNNLPYRRFPLIVSLKKHYQLLKKNSFRDNIFEEVM